MTVFFTDEEMKYINTSFLKWTIKADCPDNLKRQINEKLEYLYAKKYKQTRRV